jgi:class 3 adenylate cyclase
VSRIAHVIECTNPYPEAMRVPRTFCFVDLTGFTNFTAEHGDDAAATLLSAFRKVAREVASARGVRVAKWLGDGLMVVAVEQSDTIAFALDLEHEASECCQPLSLRIGIASGFALLFEGDDYIGSAVNLASRLCDAAGPGDILLPAELVHDLPAGAVAVLAGERVLPGFTEPISVVELSGEVAPTAHFDTGELWTRTPFAV